jgi:hypothetical protein
VAIMNAAAYVQLSLNITYDRPTFRSVPHKPIHERPEQLNTGHTQENGAVLMVNTIKTAPFFCVCPVCDCEMQIYHFTFKRMYNHIFGRKLFGPQGRKIFRSYCKAS